MQTLTIARPDDWHLHLRDGAAMAAVLPDTARRFGRAIVMPNLKPPVTTVEQAAAYRERILSGVPRGLTSPQGAGRHEVAVPSEARDGATPHTFQPLMVLYLTDNMPPSEIEKAKSSGFVHAVKLYPAGATTNSDAGVTDLGRCRATLAKMEALGLPLLVHGEVTDPAVDVFDREAVFIERVLQPLLKDFPALKVVLEHVTTRDGVDFVLAHGANVAATITAHHLLLNRNAIFQGGIRPHHYCLPVLKRERHRQALVAKEAACGCAGCYTAHAGIELYAEAFEAAGALDKLEAFASHFGADFYGLPRNAERVTLVKEIWTVPATLPYIDGDVLVPLRANETVAWRLT
jgi:dihydroorotase